VLICAENGVKLCISVKEDITDRLECTIEPNAIAEVISNSKLRDVVE
jgi:hypothetical protein